MSWWARSRACATPCALNGQRTSTLPFAIPCALKTLSAWRTRSGRSIGVPSSSDDVRCEQQVVPRLVNRPVRETNALRDRCDIEVADRVDAGPHDRRRDPDNQAIDELLGKERRDDTSAALDEQRSYSERSQRPKCAREVDALRPGVDDVDADGAVVITTVAAPLSRTRAVGGNRKVESSTTRSGDDPGTIRTVSRGSSTIAVP